MSLLSPVKLLRFLLHTKSKPVSSRTTCFAHLSWALQATEVRLCNRITIVVLLAVVLRLIADGDFSHSAFTQFVERYFSSIAVERHVSTRFVIIWSFYGKGGVYYYWQVIRRGAKTKMALLMLSSEAKAFYLPSPSADAAAMLLMLCSVPIMANKDPPTNRKRLSAYSQAANSAPKTRK